MKEIFSQHGGKLNTAIKFFGGSSSEWLDLSTGINPREYPIPKINLKIWKNLPDDAEFSDLEKAARNFWNIPDETSIISASGASALIALIPRVSPSKTVSIPSPTYSEHAISFRAADYRQIEENAEVQVIVNPNNPDGSVWNADDVLKRHRKLTIIDESFCDTVKENSLIELSGIAGFIILKSFGKFWGLGGLRLGFAIGLEQTLKPIRQALGPWQVSGPALNIGTLALKDLNWAHENRRFLEKQSTRLDALMNKHNATVIGGTSLFRLYHVDKASSVFEKLALKKILSRTFEYNQNWLRLGMPGNRPNWLKLQEALAE